MPAALSPAAFVVEVERRITSLSRNREQFGDQRRGFSEIGVARPRVASSLSSLWSVVSFGLIPAAL